MIDEIIQDHRLLKMSGLDLTELFVFSKYLLQVSNLQEIKSVP